MSTEMKFTALLFGAVIEQGPKDWQIIQQKNGKVDIYLSGHWSIDIYTGEECVYARIVEECSGEIVIPWTRSSDLGDQKWEVLFRNVPAGGLYRIETGLNNDLSKGLEWSIRGDSIHHLGVGDIFVIAGQSNATGFGKEPIYDPPELGVHLFKNSGKWDIACNPLGDSTNTKNPINRDRVNTGQSPYLNFAKQLKRYLGYPIGLVQTSRGASEFELWNPNQKGELYDNMVESIRLAGENISGILWYQGCSDANIGNCENYFERFEIMVEKLREDLKLPELPFLTVQLNRFMVAQEIVQGVKEQPGDVGWGTLREAQRQAILKMKGIYMVPANDLKLGDIIHNSSASNMLLGERLAKLALKHLYGMNMMADAPNIIQAVKTDNKEVRLSFCNVCGSLAVYEVSADRLPFSLKDDIGNLSITKYIIQGNIVIMEIDREIVGNAFVSHAYERSLKCDPAYDTTSFLPVLSFYNVLISEEVK